MGGTTYGTNKVPRNGNLSWVFRVVHEDTDILGEQTGSVYVMLPTN